MTDSDIGNDEFLARLALQLEEEERERIAEAVLTRADIILQLKELGATKVEVEYDGSCDEGYVEAITATNADGTVVELEDDLRSDIDEYVCDRLPSGWEDNEGSFGVVAFDVVKESVSFKYNKRFIKYTSGSWEE